MVVRLHDGGTSGKTAHRTLLRKPTRNWDIWLRTKAKVTGPNYRCLAAVVARARHRWLRIQDNHRDAASGDAESQGNE